MLARAAEGSVREGDWLVATTQTAGRGRQGRAWSSPPGNLYGSGLVEVRASDPPAPTLAMVAGAAVWDALALADAMLKWPNDLVYPSCPAIADRRGLKAPVPGTIAAVTKAATFAKLAGVLLERHGRHVVVGVGANLAHHPHFADRPTTSLAAMGCTLSVNDAIAALASTFARWLDIWRTYGLDPIRAAWIARAHPTGTALSAETADGGRIDGSFDGLTDDCALRLRLANGDVRVIRAGDVFLV